MATVLSQPEATDELVYASFPIERVEKDEQGNLIILGVASDGTLDSDDQIVDPEFSGPALAEWLRTGGNVRMSHDPHRPVGKGLQVQVDRDGDGKHWVKSKIVDPLAKSLIAEGVLGAYSIGIARPVIMRDVRAKGGRIASGHIAELSVVDRPSNPSAKFEICKAAYNGDAEFVGKMFGADALLKKAAGTISLEVPEDVSMSFSPADLAKIINNRNGSVEPEVEKATLNAARENKIPSGDFAYISGSGERKLPVHDKSHVQNAMARWNQTQFDSPDKRTKAARKIVSRARKYGIEVDPDSGIARAASGGKSVEQDLIAPDETAEKADRSLAVDNREDEDDDSEAQGFGEGPEDDDQGKSVIPDEIKAAMRFRSLGVPHEIGVLHDLTCPAFDPGVVDKCYPMNSFATLDDSYWQREAMELAAVGDLDEAVRMTDLWGMAQTLKIADPVDLFILRQQLHKAFQDANPGPGRAPIPSGQIKPGSYNRPYISGGHSAPSPGHDGPNSAKVPSSPMGDPTSYNRGYLTSGHASQSPAAQGSLPSVPRPSGTGNLGSVNLGSVPRSALIDAMGQLHSATASTNSDMCPLKPEEDFNYARTAVPTPGSPDAAAAPGSSKAEDAEVEETFEKAASPPPPKKKGKKKKGLPPWLQDNQDGKNGKANKSSQSGDNSDADDDDDDDDDANDQPDRDEKAITRADLEKLISALTEAQQPAGVAVRKTEMAQQVREVVKPIRKKLQSLEAEKQQEVYKQQLAQYQHRLEELQRQIPAQQQPVQLQEQLKQLQVLQQQIADANKPSQAELTRREVRVATKPILKRLESLAAEKSVPATQPAAEREAITEALKPLVAKIAEQERRLWKQEKKLSKRQLEKSLQAETPAVEEVPQVPSNVVTKDELTQWAAPLLSRLESQETLIRKQHKQIMKSQLKPPTNLSEIVLPPIPQPPAPSTDFMTLEAIDELARKLDAQPSITKEDLSDFTDRLVSKMQAQPGVTRETLLEVIEKLEDRAETPPPGVTKEALAEVTEKLEQRLQDASERMMRKHQEMQQDSTAQQMRDMLAPLIGRLENQDRLLRKQKKRMQQQAMEKNVPMPAVAPSMFAAKSASAPPVDYELRHRLEEQERLIRRQERQLRKQEKMLGAVPDLEKAVNALASLPDPHTVAYKGVSFDNVNKTSAGLAGAQDMAAIAGRTQAMMLTEWENQFRNSPDPAQREVAWRHIIQMRGLSDKE